MDISYHLYDTALFGVTAGVTHPLFQIIEGGDATHVSDFTNMRGAGQLPGNEKFSIRWIGVCFESNQVLADVDDWYLNGFVRLTYNNLVMLQSPIIPLIAYSDFGGHFTQAVAADRTVIGRSGSGYYVDPMIVVKGNTGFKVEVFQGVAIATASQRVKVILEGILSRPEAGG